MNYAQESDEGEHALERIAFYKTSGNFTLVMPP